LSYVFVVIIKKTINSSNQHRRKSLFFKFSISISVLLYSKHICHNLFLLSYLVVAGPNPFCSIAQFICPYLSIRMHTINIRTVWIIYRSREKRWLRPSVWLHRPSFNVTFMNTSNWNMEQGIGFASIITRLGWFRRRFKKPISLINFFLFFFL